MRVPILTPAGPMRLAAALRAQGVAEFARVGMVEPRGKTLLRLM